MQADDGVRWVNLFGSILLFWGSYRSQKWAKGQADREDQAAENRAARAVGTSSSRPSRAAAPGEFDQAGAEVLSRPLFDRKAYILLCVGFAFTTLASLIDIVDHTTRGHLFFELLLTGE